MWAPKGGGMAPGEKLQRRTGKSCNCALERRKGYSAFARKGRKNKLPPTFSGRRNEISTNLHLYPDVNSRRAHAAPDDVRHENWAPLLLARNSRRTRRVASQTSSPLRQFQASNRKRRRRCIQFERERDEHSIPYQKWQKKSNAPRKCQKTFFTIPPSHHVTKKPEAR